MTGTPHNHRLVQFKVDHLREQHWPERPLLDHSTNLGLKLYAEHPGWSLFCNERFIAAAGIIIPYRGFGEGWAMVTAAAHTPRHAIAFHRATKALMRNMAEMYGIVRLQALVRDNFPTAEKWIISLGFEHECTLERAGVNGENLCVYRRFFSPPA
jgi:hypothetical protein